MIGVFRKTGRLFHPGSKRTVIVPLDHGMSEGMLPGLDDVGSLVEGLAQTPVQGIVLHKGMAMSHLSAIGLSQNLIVHLSAGTRHGIPPYARTIVGSVAEALRLGADMVSVQAHIGNDMEERMLADLGAVIDEAHNLGVPVLAMIYARGGQIVNETDPSLVAHCIRLGAEMGADIIKVAYSGHHPSFRRAVAACPVPVVISGGPKNSDARGFLRTLEEALDTGIAGVCVGRNVFQSEDPFKMLHEICRLVHHEE
ncbi:MAG: Fructose-bisphosphate aldolase [Desulfomicrobiaceae bacterium]|nr:fructose-bisphosphate aldolase [Desulfomicrobiaceae bacterium]MBZ4685803.1 Fructose-bisphosphate aldolase [Desulfomicrobiaceae bacterium]